MNGSTGIMTEPNALVSQVMKLSSDRGKFLFLALFSQPGSFFFDDAIIQLAEKWRGLL